MVESVKKSEQFIKECKNYQSQFTELQKYLSQHQIELKKSQEAAKVLKENLLQFQAKSEKHQESCQKIVLSYSKVESKESAVQCEILNDCPEESRQPQECCKPEQNLVHDQNTSNKVFKKSKQKSKQYQIQTTDYKSKFEQTRAMYESEHKLAQSQKEELKRSEQKLRKCQVELKECQSELKQCHTMYVFNLCRGGLLQWQVVGNNFFF